MATVATFIKNVTTKGVGLEFLGGMREGVIKVERINFLQFTSS
jgi:hypothetical protein